ncbi:MAG: hypothetical protein HEQ16_05870 [Bosea sp.]|jgi:hypothetical protein|nr:hypothetical protein [Bosea sp. (in: a-proteobacteria)]
MLSTLRNLALIAAIAWWSPVHEQEPTARLDALREAPGQLLADVVAAAPALAVRAAAGIDPASRDALARKLTEMALAESQGGAPLQRP